MRSGAVNAGVALVAAVAVSALPGCRDHDVAGPGPSEAVGFATAYGIWTPGPDDSCSREIHDRYSAVGPDGLLYPTWHPPVDPATGCTFGHEHGRDPRGSNLYGWIGPIPFGHANQQLEIHDPAHVRHEDHVGHKIEWENDFRLDLDAGGDAVLEIRCDMITKLHQGTHSKDAFTNNLHELVFAARCSDKTEFHITLLTPIGDPGEFRTSCGRNVVAVGPATPRNSPSGGGVRIIPSVDCLPELLVAEGQRSNFNVLRESWEVSARIRTDGGATLVSLNPYYQVLHPSRYYDPAKEDLVGRPLDLCYSSAALGGLRARGSLCDESTNGGTLVGLPFSHPSSMFNGVRRFVDINTLRVSNGFGGPDVVYTDPFGLNGRESPFPGSVRQFVAKVDNSGRRGSGPPVGRDRDYGGPGVHAPN